ncbi:rolling circle replication-associated protein [Sinirhodobacter huangdaonensis]|uniref:rolling circle replication-associated protein n=1 Tax=Paenirhodobacter huangdaonensis TaxID=2501515 RepID=UPI0036D212B2
MEKTQHEHCLVLALTYSDETPEGRDGARMFAYADVQAFMGRLRAAARRQAKRKRWNLVPVLRFLVAGEQGDRNGRCHWHMILYSNFEVTALGEVRGRYGVLTRLADMLTIGKRKKRLHWSMWPFGFVTVQEPDQGGMNYVLSYCLKDQFTGEKSQDTMREAKAENFATGLFRMSKRPAIGEAWLYSKMEALDAMRAVLPAVELRIPDFHGYYVPSGAFREKTLWALVALNRRVVWATGAPAPQWPSLLASCREREADLEILNGPQTDEEEDPLEVEIERRRSQAAGESARRDFARRCGAAVACDWCLGFLTEAALAERGIERFEDEAGVWQYRSTPGRASLAERTCWMTRERRSARSVPRIPNPRGVVHGPLSRGVIVRNKPPAPLSSLRAVGAGGVVELAQRQRPVLARGTVRQVARCLLSVRSARAAECPRCRLCAAPHDWGA